MRPLRGSAELCGFQGARFEKLRAQIIFILPLAVIPIVSAS